MMSDKKVGLIDRQLAFVREQLDELETKKDELLSYMGQLNYEKWKWDIGFVQPDITEVKVERQNQNIRDNQGNGKLH